MVLTHVPPSMIITADGGLGVSMIISTGGGLGAPRSSSRRLSSLFQGLVLAGSKNLKMSSLK